MSPTKSFLQNGWIKPISRREPTIHTRAFTKRFKQVLLCLIKTLVSQKIRQVLNQNISKEQNELIKINKIGMKEII